MHTEEQARMLWCPLVRISEIVIREKLIVEDKIVPGWHKPTRGSPCDNSCISSQCSMLWRWDNDEHGVGKQSGTEKPMRGYCGIGGRP